MSDREDVTVWIEGQDDKREVCVGLGDGPVMRMTDDEVRAFIALLQQAVSDDSQGTDAT